MYISYDGGGYDGLRPRTLVLYPASKCKSVFDMAPAIFYPIVNEICSQFNLHSICF
jgi:hypothetical protein